ncbi:MAG: hypothetical protein ACRYFU_00800 [Janthinobacterium lividum]
MRFEDCATEGLGKFMMAPFRRSQPEPDWVAAYQTGLLPEAVMRLYTRANFLSFGSEPPFLNDTRRQLFSYFGSMLRGIKQSLADAEEELIGLELAESLSFDLGKESRGEPWNPDAPRQSKKHFRLLMISLCSALDCTAEITALILPGVVPKLKLGRAEFAQIESWLERAPPTPSSDSTPQQLKGLELYSSLRPLAIRTDEAKDWLSILRLYRNKAAHLGSEHFREMGFHDRNRVFYTFLPTKWPVIWEEHIKLHDPEPRPTPRPLQEIFGPLMRQDKITFVRDVRQEVIKVVAAAITVLDLAYSECQKFPVNEQSLEALDKSMKTFEFQAFPA